MTHAQSLVAFISVIAFTAPVFTACSSDGGSADGMDIVILGEEMPEPDAMMSEPEPEPDPEPEPEPEPEPMGSACDGPGFAAEYERMSYTDVGGLTMVSYSKRPTSRNPVVDILLLEFHIERGFVMAPGRYDLADIGADLNDCQICVVGFKGQNIAQRSREAVLMATSGIVEITSDGSDGQPFEASFDGVLLQHVNVTQGNAGNLNVEMIDDDIKWCLDDFEVSTMIREPPAEIGEEVKDFTLQNCETGEMVNVYEEAAGYDAVWILGTAGWCPACKTMLFKGSGPRGVPSMFQAVVDNPQLKGMIILGENSSRSQATLRYCQRHANYYRQGWAEENPGVPMPASLEDASMFYLDHDGVRSFDQLFGSLKTYTNDEGAFGLPWNAALEVGDPVMYRYADGSGQPESLGQILEGMGINFGD